MTKEEIEEGKALIDSCVRDSSGWDSQVKSSYDAEQWLKRHAVELLALAEEARWRSVAEEPPPTWRNVIGIVNEQIITVYVDSTGKWVEGSTGLARYLDHEPSHWRPLPRFGGE